MRSKIDGPNLVNTRHEQFQGLLGEEIIVPCDDGSDLSTEPYEILKSLIQSASGSSERVSGSYHQAFSRIPLGCIRGVEASILLTADTPSSPSGIWLPREVEIFGLGIESVFLELYETKLKPRASINGNNSSNVEIQSGFQRFFYELGALVQPG